MMVDGLLFKSLQQAHWKQIIQVDFSYCILVGNISFQYSINYFEMQDSWDKDGLSKQS